METAGKTWELIAAAAAVTPCWSNASVDAQNGRSKELRGDDGSDLEGELVQGKLGCLYLEQNGMAGLHSEPLGLEPPDGGWPKQPNP